MMTRRADDRDEHKTRHIDSPLGERLRGERNARNMTRATLAGALDISESTLQKYEEGQVRISASRLWQMCRLLDVDVSDFFSDLPHQVEPDALGGLAQTGSPFVDDSGRAKQVAALARAAARLPDDRLAIALDLVKALKPKG